MGEVCLVKGGSRSPRGVAKGDSVCGVVQGGSRSSVGGVVKGGSRSPRGGESGMLRTVRGFSVGEVFVELYVG